MRINRDDDENPEASASDVIHVELLDAYRYCAIEYNEQELNTFLRQLYEDLRDFVFYMKRRPQCVPYISEMVARIRDFYLNTAITQFYTHNNPWYQLEWAINDDSYDNDDSDDSYYPTEDEKYHHIYDTEYDDENEDYWDNDAEYSDSDDTYYGSGF